MEMDILKKISKILGEHFLNSKNNKKTLEKFLILQEN